MLLLLLLNPRKLTPNPNNRTHQPPLPINQSPQRSHPFNLFLLGRRAKLERPLRGDHLERMSDFLLVVFSSSSTHTTGPSTSTNPRTSPLPTRTPYYPARSDPFTSLPYPTPPRARRRLGMIPPTHASTVFRIRRVRARGGQGFEVDRIEDTTEGDLTMYLGVLCNAVQGIDST